MPTDIVHSHTRYGISSYFRSEGKRKTVENAVSDGFGLNLSKTVQAMITKFLQLDELIASRAVFVIVSGSDGLMDE